MDPTKDANNRRPGMMCTVRSKNVKLTSFNEAQIIPTLELPTKYQTIALFSLLEGIYKNNTATRFLLTHDIHNLEFEFFQHEFSPKMDNSGRRPKVIPHEFVYNVYLGDGMTTDPTTHVRSRTNDGLFGIITGKIISQDMPSY